MHDRTLQGVARALLRLVVPSPDGRRVLVRPNGLAGWALPAIAVDADATDWGPADTVAASRLVGAPVRPVRRLLPRTWLVVADGRVPAAGNTWIAVEEAERAGADAAAVRAWGAAPTDRSD